MKLLHGDLMKMFERTNTQIASCISNSPKYFLSCSLILAALLSASLFNCNFEDDIRRSFSPPRSRASREEEIHSRFFNMTSSPRRTFILFYAKDGSSMLKSQNMDELLRIDAILRKQIELIDERSGEKICEPLCRINRPFFIFWDELKKAQSNVIGNESDSDFIFDFPTAILFGHEVFVGMNMFGVRTADEMFANRSTITHVTTVVLWYFSQESNPRIKGIIDETALEMFEMSKARNASSLIQFDIFGDHIANKEMLRGALEATRLMLTGFFLLLIFVFTVVWHKMSLSRNLPKVVFATILSPFLAAATAFGILSWLRFTFYAIMCVTPFLILGIGVDDAFIMLQSWTQYRTIRCKKERLAKVFIEIGPSISITSLTNCIAFGIGYFTPTPQMSMFCLCTSVACFLDYILTFTLFAPILLLSDDEASNKYMSAEKLSFQQQIHKKWISIYSRFVCSIYGKLSALLILVLLYCVCTIGVLNMKSTFEPAKAFPSDSPLSTSLEGIRSVFNEFFPLQIIVNSPPNISDSAEYEDFYKLVTSLESVKNSYGRERTILFLKAYEKFDRRTFEVLNAIGLAGETQYRPSYDHLAFFLGQINNPKTIQIVRDERGKVNLKAFHMTMIAHNMSEWSSRAAYVDRCRTVLTRYPQFNATVFDADSALLDLILTAKFDLIGSIAVTVLCMAIVCLVFVSSKLGVLIVTFTISSICFTLVGALSWWGADMDPVTMVDVLIATGFSVDYTAHIAYKFCKASGKVRERIEQSFSEMCEPMLQAGTSTALCMLPLMFVPTYAILVFAKTVFLVVGLGLLHGLFILPVLLVTVTRHTTVGNTDESTQNETTRCQDLKATKEPLIL